MEMLAKPSGILLRDHRQHVYDEALGILTTWPYLHEKYARISEKNLSQLLREAAWWHDLGKEHPIWQDACRKDYQVYQAWRKEQGLNPNNLDADEYRRFSREKRKNEKWATSALMKAGLRHEFASLKMMQEKGESLSSIVQVAIAAHHRKLSFKHMHRWKEDGGTGDGTGPFYGYWNAFVQESNLYAFDDAEAWKKRLFERYEYAGIRALLQLADTRASRAEGGEALPELTRFSLGVKYDSLRPVQEAALSLADQEIAILRAPTGSGKTYAALLWAEQQIHKGRADRLVIAMPTRFTSNALSMSISENVGETGLYHSSAWFSRYGDLTDPIAKSIAREQQILAQILATPVTVCTIDHLLMSLTGTKENHHATFFFMANSAVVFDEADFYDPFVQANLVVLIKTLKLLKVPILIMSATVPDSARELYEVPQEIVESETFDSNNDLSTNLSPKRRLNWAGQAEFPEAVREILEEMVTTGAGIIYANTVARALAYFRWFQQNYPQLHPILYHSRFTESDKKAIEAKLLSTLGKDAWENPTTSFKGIAILTQIGEMSVNISTPIMLSDLCPWDRLAQRIGRLNRFDEHEIGTAYVVEPMKKGETYVAPYGELIDRSWVASPAFTQTLEDLATWPSEDPDNHISSEELVDRVNALYPKPPDFSGTSHTNQLVLLEMMSQNWMIVPDTHVDEATVEVSSKWKSRHIPPQTMVFVEPPEDFDSFNDYLRFALEYGVACPTWMIEKEQRKPEDLQRLGKLLRKVGDEDWVFCYTSHYASNKGLAFLYETDQTQEEEDD